MGYGDEKLNFLKLAVNKWTLIETIQLYKHDQFCWDYCILTKCKNERDCKKIHDPNMIFDRLWQDDAKSEDIEYFLYCCEYLVSTKQYCNNSTVYLCYAKACKQFNHNDIAEKLVLKSIEINPNDDRAHYLYTILLDNVHQNYKKTAIHYQKAIDLNPRAANYYGDMADLFCGELCKYSESLIYAKKAFSLDKDAEWAYSIGEAYHNLNQLSLAKYYYEKTLKLRTDDCFYGFEQQDVERKIQEIDNCDNFFASLTNDDENCMYNREKFINDKTKQIELILSCINMGMPFSYLIFLTDRFDVSIECLKEAMDQLKLIINQQTTIATKTQENTKEKGNGNVIINVQQMKKSVWTIMKLCVEVMNQLDYDNEMDEKNNTNDEQKTNETNKKNKTNESDVDWKHELLNLIIPKHLKSKSNSQLHAQPSLGCTQNEKYRNNIRKSTIEAQ